MRAGSLRTSTCSTTRQSAPARRPPQDVFGQSRRHAGRTGTLPLSRAADAGRDRMTTFDDREKAFENKFAHDEEMRFRIVARRNRLIGEWAARQMGLSDVETEYYSKHVFPSDL